MGAFLKKAGAFLVKYAVKYGPELVKAALAARAAKAAEKK